MLNGGGAVLSSRLKEGGAGGGAGGAAGVRARLVCRAPGEFIAFCNPAPIEVRVEGGLSAEGDVSGGGAHEEGLSAPLRFEYAEETGLLSVELPGGDGVHNMTLSVQW